MLKLITLIPKTYLAKKLPDIIAYVLTRALEWVYINKRKDYDKTIEVTKKIIDIMNYKLEALKDNELDKKELQELIEMYRNLIKGK
jgi:hypothetical protein